MELIKQPTSLPIKNIDKRIQNKKKIESFVNMAHSYLTAFVVSFVVHLIAAKLIF